MINDPNPIVHEHSHSHPLHFKQISWSAIVAGALVGIGLSFLLNLFSVAIGLSAFHFGEDGRTVIAGGGLVAILIGGIVAMYITGWVAGFLGRACCGRHNWGILYGFAAWSLALIITALIASNIGNYVNAYGNFVSNPATIAISERGATTPAPAGATTTDRNDTAIQNAQTMANLVKPTEGLAVGAFAMFVIFLIGAISSSFGGYFGMERRKRCMVDDKYC